MGYSIYHLIMLAVTVAIIYLVLRPARFYTFENYRRDNPECAKPGRVSCKHCGGTSLWMKRKDFFIGKGWAHTCRTCGKELYCSQ